nr:reverse transcriptase domain-containing protein [Tanacetum cinerariifolium]
MQTRSSSRLVSNPSSNPTPSTNPNPKGRNPRRSKQRIDEFNLDELSPQIVTMADQRIMAQLLQAPTEGYEDAIVVPAITADNFELKHARIWLEKEPPRSIFTWDDIVSKFTNQFFPPSKTTNLRNEITNFQQCFDESFSEAWDRFKDLLKSYPHHGFSELHQLDTFYNALNSKDQDSLNSAAGVSTNTSTSGISLDVAELKDMVKALLLDKKRQNQAPATVKAVEESYVVENELEATKDTVHPTNNESIEDVQPQVFKSKSLILTSEPVNSPTIEPIITPVSAPRPNLRPSIPYPSRMQDQKLRDKANDQREKFFQIFKDLNFNISFAEALIQIPKFSPSIKSLLTNKDKLCELARTPLNEHYSAVLLKKLPEKLGDPGKFMIPCDFPGKAECLALADLGASINLMPLFMWNKLSLPDLTPTCMTLELPNRSISRPVGVAEDVYVKVGSFHFLADFVVVDFDADPRVPLILERSFLKTERALIDVFKGKLTLRLGKEAITFNLDQTLRYSANYSEMIAKRIDVIDMACKDYSQEVLGFFDVITSGNPTPYYDPIISTSSLTLTPFENSDFLLEEVDAFLAIEDDPTSPKVDQGI